MISRGLLVPYSSSSSSSSSVYRVYSSLSIILQRDSQDKSPAGQYLQLKTGGNLIYTVRNWAGGKLPSVSLNSSTELAVVAADGRLFHCQMDLGKKEFRFWLMESGRYSDL
jgi:hypothetical protein